MKKIWKFGIQLIGGIQTIMVPIEFEIVHFDVQGPQLFVWGEVDPDSPTVERRFQVYGTGNEIERHRKHIKSIVVNGFVRHLYEVLQ